MKRYGDRDWGELEDYPGRAIVEPLYPPKDRHWEPEEAETMQEKDKPDPMSLAFTRQHLTKAIDTIPSIVATALGLAADDPGDAARVCHSVKTVAQFANELKKVCDSALETARLRLIDVMSESGQPTVTVDTPDGLRRLSSVSTPGYPTLRDPEQRDDATAALSLDPSTEHLVALKYDTRAIRKWATGLAVDAEGKFHEELLPESLTKHFTFPTKIGISDNKA